MLQDADIVDGTACSRLVICLNEITGMLYFVEISPSLKQFILYQSRALTAVLFTPSQMCCCTEQ